MDLLGEIEAIVCHSSLRQWTRSTSLLVNPPRLLTCTPVARPFHCSPTEVLFVHLESLSKIHVSYNVKGLQCKAGSQYNASAPVNGG